MGILRFIAAASTALLVFERYAFVPEIFKPGLCDFVPLGGVNETVLPSECYFSESYWEARAKFRMLAKAAGAELRKEEIVSGDYTMDFAVFRGKGTGVVVHSSATHGVEGFAGSGIQCAKLHQLAIDARKNAGKLPDADASPTIIFVHAVNPYGMAHFRRFNEHNVDLNRNAIPAEEWPDLLKRDPNVAKYEEFASVFNPTRAPSIFDAYIGYFSRAVYNIAVHGFVSLKRAVVTGQYVSVCSQPCSST